MTLTHFFLGNLTWDAVPHQWFTIGGTAAIVVGLAAVAGLLTHLKKWTWLWKEWFTSTDPKKIGIMYIVMASLMLFRGGLDAAMIWLQQSLSAGNAPGYLGATHGYLDANHFQQIFTAHGDIMVFFVTMGFFFGIMNLVVPLQIGARDLAFPFLNSLGFWLYVAGAVFINMFFVVGGQFAGAGWLSIPPLSELMYSTGTGVDYWIWSLQISGLGTLLGAINFIVTILKMRVKGMTLMKMPLFTWTALCSMVLALAAFPVLTATTFLLWLDRFFGMHFFTTTMGGNPMLYINLIWMWGHPEVYILVIPAFGMFSEIVSVFSGKKVFGYASMVAAAIGITLLSFLVWLHHFFTMGAGADVDAFFGIMTGVIAIPTAVQIFNWVATMFRGRIRFASPMQYFLGFVSLFTFGGMAGVLLSLPGADFELHNSLFLVAHFHTMIVSAALFGIFAGITYWFPKFTGFVLDERLGKRAFWLWLIGFFVSFVPLYILGFMGATRRLDHYAASTGYQPFFITAGVGVCIIAAAALTQVWQIVASVRARTRVERRDMTGDPWDGHTLEWATPSPVPFYNFAVTPEVHARDAFWEMKKDGWKPGPRPSLEYRDIEMSRNTGMAVYLSAFVFVAAFGLVWHIIWMAALGVAGAIACVIIRSFDDDTEYVIPAAEVEKMDILAWKSHA